MWSANRITMGQPLVAGESINHLAIWHTAISAIVAAAIYLTVSLLSFQLMGAGNGVIGGELVPNSDHWPVAEELISGKGLTNFSYAPGFSIYMVAALKASEYWGGTYYFWRLVQDGCSTALTAALLMSLMWRLTGSTWAGWGAILAFLYNVTYSAGTSADLAMAAFMPWFIGGAYLFVIAIQANQIGGILYALLAGILFAISGFLRPDILLFIPFVALVFYCVRWIAGLHGGSQFNSVWRNFRQSIFSALAVGFVLVLLPWVIYATVRSGTLVVYSTNFVPSHIDGMLRFPGNRVSEAFARKWPEMDKHRIHHVEALRSSSTLVHEENSVLQVIRFHFSLLQSYPVDYLRLWAQKIVRPWYASDSSKWNVILGAQSLLLFALALPAIKLWISKKGIDLGFVLGVCMVCYFWLIALAVLSINRYMPPAYPFLGMFIGLGAHILWLEGKFHRNRSSISDIQTG